jgi:hypothetical protein
MGSVELYRRHELHLLVVAVVLGWGRSHFFRSYSEPVWLVEAMSSVELYRRHGLLVAVFGRGRSQSSGRFPGAAVFHFFRS